MPHPVDWSWRDTIIINMRRHNDPAHLIARVAKINPDTLRKRERVLGLKPRKPSVLRPDRGDAWTTAQVRSLRRMWKQNETVAAIAKETGRSESAIWTKRSQLKLPSRREKCDRQLAFSVSQEQFDWVEKEAALACKIRSRFLEELFRAIMTNRLAHPAKPYFFDPAWKTYGEWTAVELAILRERWNKGDPTPAIQKRLPHRTISSIRVARAKLGLASRPPVRSGRHLTLGAKEDLHRWMGREAARLGLQRYQFMQRCLDEARTAQIDQAEEDKWDTAI